MKVYYCDKFKGHYPVGQLAVVVAANPLEASAYLEIELAQRGIAQEITEDRMIEIDPSTSGIAAIIDGEY